MPFALACSFLLSGPGVYLPACRASLLIQIFEKPQMTEASQEKAAGIFSRDSLPNTSARKCHWGAPPFPWELLWGWCSLACSHLSSTAAALQPWTSLIRTQAQWTAFPAWPWTCLVTMDLPSDCWSLSEPGSYLWTWSWLWLDTEMPSSSTDINENEFDNPWLTQYRSNLHWEKCFECFELGAANTFSPINEYLLWTKPIIWAYSCTYYFYIVVYIKYIFS